MGKDIVIYCKKYKDTLRWELALGDLENLDMVTIMYTDPVNSIANILHPGHKDLNWQRVEHEQNDEISYDTCNVFRIGENRMIEDDQDVAKEMVKREQQLEKQEMRAEEGQELRKRKFV